jgi:hypothetical protein
MILANVIYSFIVMATVITIINYDCTVIMIVTYDPKTFIVQATGLPGRNIVAYWASSTATKIKKSTTLTGERWRRRKR